MWGQTVRDEDGKAIWAQPKGPTCKAAMWASYPEAEEPGAEQNTGWVRGHNWVHLGLGVQVGRNDTSSDISGCELGKWNWRGSGLAGWHVPGVLLLALGLH